MLDVTDLWKKTYPGANVGCMVVSNVLNPEQCAVLEQQKRMIEIELQEKFVSKEELVTYAPIVAYRDYYKRYKKTYHVLHQMESVIFKGKKIPRVAALVETMFMAELKNGLLTAGHDYQAVAGKLKLDAALGTESYTLINGKQQTVKSGDMIIADARGIISSIIYGPDFRTRILPDTKTAVFIVYAPPGISGDTVLDHLADIYAYIKLVAGNAKIEFQKIYTA